MQIGVDISIFSISRYDIGKIKTMLIGNQKYIVSQRTWTKNLRIIKY